MSLKEIADELVAGCREGREAANLDKLYAADAVSVIRDGDIVSPKSDAREPLKAQVLSVLRDMALGQRPQGLGGVVGDFAVPPDPETASRAQLILQGHRQSARHRCIQRHAVRQDDEAAHLSRSAVR